MPSSEATDYGTISSPQCHCTERTRYKTTPKAYELVLLAFPKIDGVQQTALESPHLNYEKGRVVLL